MSLDAIRPDGKDERANQPDLNSDTHRQVTKAKDVVTDLERPARIARSQQRQPTIARQPGPATCPLRDPCDQLPVNNSNVPFVRGTSVTLVPTR